MSWQDKALAAFWDPAFANEPLDSHRRIEAAIAAAAASLLPSKDAPMTDHPITPPPERFKQWEDDILNERDNVDHVLDCAWRDGFRAGADQQLDACYADLRMVLGPAQADWRRSVRRPKPPSLAEEAHDALGRFFSNAHTQASQMTQDFEILRHAVQRLQELENNG